MLPPGWQGAVQQVPRQETAHSRARQEGGLLPTLVCIWIVTDCKYRWRKCLADLTDGGHLPGLVAEGGDLPGGGAGVDGVLDEVVGDDEHAGPPPRDHAVREVQSRVQRGAPRHPTTHTAITHFILRLRICFKYKRLDNSYT